MVRASALILLALAAGCTTAPPLPVENPRAVWCAHSEPRRPSADEIAAMSLDDKRAAVAHNRQGALWCGWGA